jgi:hypothetical protein
MSGSTTPPLLATADPPGTDDELSTLLGSIRRHVLDAPEEVWDPSVKDAAKTVSSALADRLDPKRQR